MRDYLDDDRPLHLRRSNLVTRTVRRPLALALFLCVLAGGLLFVDRSGRLDPARDLLHRGLAMAAAPLTGLRTTVADLWAGATATRSLQAENEALRREVGELQAELIAAEQALAENLRLREQLAIEERYPWRLLGADIVARSPDSGRRMVTIARGEADGVQPGMAVIGQVANGPTALVGIVEATSSHTAQILLITDFASQISARVLDDGETVLGLVKGQWQRGSRLRLEQLERDFDLAPGAVVVSGGISAALDVPFTMASVPADIPIGRVAAVTAGGHAATAELQPFADPDQVRYVWVILNPAD